MHPSFPHRLRAAVERRIRQWFATRDVLEVQCPSIVPNPGLEPELDAFALRSGRSDSRSPGWLHTSPEYAIKASLASLETDVFTLARVYRDEPDSPIHHREFTMLEWYRGDGSMSEFMTLCESLLRAVVETVAGLPGAKAIPTWALASRPFPRASMDELFRRHLDVSLLDADAAELRAAARKQGHEVDDSWDVPTLFSFLQSFRIERCIAREEPVFVTGFPAWQSALAELDPLDRRQALRFELYLPWQERGAHRALELANAFVELLDPVEQRARFEADLRIRSDRGGATYPMPEPLLRGIARMNPTCGVALGVERLLCWLSATFWDHHLRPADFLLGHQAQ